MSNNQPDPRARKRVDWWQNKFHAYLKDARHLDFKWGENDCVMFATGCIDLLTGSNYYAEAKLRYPYSSEAEAREWMAKIGGITGLVSSFLGEPVNWGALGIGDIVLVKELPRATEMEMLCIHDGTQIVARSSAIHTDNQGSTYRGGMMRIPFAYAIHGWRVG